MQDVDCGLEVVCDRYGIVESEARAFEEVSCQENPLHFQLSHHDALPIPTARTFGLPLRGYQMQVTICAQLFS
jgi:hypothetical protein